MYTHWICILLFYFFEVSSETSLGLELTTLKSRAACSTASQPGTPIIIFEFQIEALSKRSWKWIGIKFLGQYPFLPLPSCFIIEVKKVFCLFVLFYKREWNINGRNINGRIMILTEGGKTPWGFTLVNSHWSWAPSLPLFTCERAGVHWISDVVFSTPG